MAKRIVSNARTSMVIRLSDPGMTPLLRAGLGGLAATLWAFDQMPANERPCGRWTVSPDSVVLEWTGHATGDYFRDLFVAAFRLTPDGFIDLPGTYARGERPPADALAELQRAFKKTFLQHGKSTQGATALRAVSFEIDGAVRVVKVQPLSSYTHQAQHAVIAKAVSRQAATVRLAGWAYPGAAQRHVAHPGSIFEYTPEQALCACFALVGCLSINLVRGAAIIVPDPEDLTAFARLRPRLTPLVAVEAHAASLSDAALQLAAAASVEEEAGQRRGVRGWVGWMLRATAWDCRQKYRVAVWQHDVFSRGALGFYSVVRDLLPLRLGVFGETNQGSDSTTVFLKTNPLRAFITENIAADRPWYRGYSTATNIAGNAPAPLSCEARKGLYAMLDQLDRAERLLVNAVHTALRLRFGAIAEESSGQPAAMHNRFLAERNKWRLALAGAKTQEQVRATLADLWSRAGLVRELQDGWEEILPLLRADGWQTARDLALVALASYLGLGKGAETSTSTNGGES